MTAIGGTVVAVVVFGASYVDGAPVVGRSPSDKMSRFTKVHHYMLGTRLMVTVSWTKSDGSNCHASNSCSGSDSLTSPLPAPFRGISALY